MAHLYAQTAFNIAYLDLNWYRATYQTEIMMASAINGYEDNYVVYNLYGEALAMAGDGFRYDASGNPTIGTVGGLGEAYEDPDGYWWDYYWVEGLNLPMADVFAAQMTASNNDDLALVKQQFAGKDLIYLSAQDDVMNGFGGNDKMYGYDGDDLLNGANGKDRLFGGNGDDTVNGGAGKDTVVGGTGKDTVKGGTGDDVIRGGAGRDREFGGQGEDIFVFKTGDDRAFIQDFDARGAVHDVLDLSGLTSITGWWDLTRNHMERDGDDVRIDAGNGDLIVLRDVALSSLDKGDFLF